MSEQSEWEDLVDRHLRGELSEIEQERLAEMLDSDPSLRQDFVARASWQADLTETVRSFEKNGSRDLDLSVVNEIESDRGQAVRHLRNLLVIAAAAILILSALLYHKHTTQKVVASEDSEIVQDASIARITGLSGSLTWTGDRGEIVRDITVGTELAGGTIEGMSPDSWFELQFHDGSKAMISGISLMTFSDAGQKRLRLREGSLSADVVPQPDGKPMLIQTRTATLTVLGTSFDVEAELPATTVTVREGTVRVTRTSDGKEIDVPAKHHVIASADRELERQPVPDQVHQWKSRIELGPDETYGKWIAATDTQPAMLKSIAFVPKEAPSVVLYLLGMGVHSKDDSPVSLKEGSTFQVRGKINFETDFYLGFQVTHPNGEFAGKFRAQCPLTLDDTRDGDAKDFVASFKLDEFGLDPSVQAYKGKLPSSPVNLLINRVWCFTHSETPSGLQVSDIELRPHP